MEQLVDLANESRVERKSEPVEWFVEQKLEQAPELSAEQMLVVEPVGCRFADFGLPQLEPVGCRSEELEPVEQRLAAVSVGHRFEEPDFEQERPVSELE